MVKFSILVINTICYYLGTMDKKKLRKNWKRAIFDGRVERNGKIKSETSEWKLLGRIGFSRVQNDMADRFEDFEA